MTNPATTKPASESKAATERWSYPFTLRDPKAPNDMHRHFMALSKMDLGFFPIAASGFPNGSIHIGEQCDGFVTEDGFHCLADGEVVAYRLDSMDQVLRYEDDFVLRYTVGFVLVRHRMALPAPGTKSTSPASAGAVTPVEASDGSIAIFSLYSYNRPFSRYPVDRDGFLKVSLPFWQGTRKYRVGTRAKDVQAPPAVVILTSVWSPFGSITHVPDAEPEVAAEPQHAQAVGLRVRAEGKASGRVVGLLPRGCLLTVRGNATQGWAQIERIERGTPLPHTLGEPVPEDIAKGWVFLGELDSTILPAPCNETVVLDEPYPVKAGERIGFLGENPGKGSAQKNGGVQPSDPRVAIEVFAGDDFPAYLAESRRRAALLPDSEKPILVIEQGARLCRFPRSPEHVAAPGHRIVPDPATPTSGAFIHGHLFHVEPQSPHIPLETGTQYGDYVRTTDHKRVTEAAYAKLSKAEKAKYPLREVLTPVGIGPCWGDRDPTRYIAAWTTPPLATTDADAVVGIQYAFSRADLDRLDATRRFVDHDGTRWWQVEVTGDDHKLLHAWVADRHHPKTHWESPHAWPGFTVADGTLFEPMEALQRIVCLTGDVHPIHEESFTPVATALGMSPMVVALEKAIDHAGTLNGKVTAEDIAHARRTPSLSRGLSRVIARFQSQWSDDVERWKKLAPFMDADWPIEMQRQEKRAWWKNVAGKVDGFPCDPHVHHIHPFGWVDNFEAAATGPTNAAEDVTYLARTLYGESRGERQEEKTAVAWVIRNRLKTERWGTTYEAVVKAPYQFTCWSKAIDPDNYDAVMNPAGSSWIECQKISLDVANADEANNPLPNVLNYYSPDAQRNLHAKLPSKYPEKPSFADEKKRYPNPLWFALIALLSIPNSHASTPNREQTVDEVTELSGSARVITRCFAETEQSWCELTYQRDKKDLQVLRLISAPTSIREKDSVVIVREPCGTACSMTYFLSGRDTNGPFGNIIAVDTDARTFAYMTGNTITIQDMFGQNVLASERLPGTLDREESLGLVEDASLTDKQLKITYMDSIGRRMIFSSSSTLSSPTDPTQR